MMHARIAIMRGAEPHAGASATIAWFRFLVFGLAPLLTLLPARPANAEALYLDWHDCWLGTTAASNLTFSCLGNFGDRLLVLGFTLDQPIDSVIAIEAVVDIEHADATLPDWWHFEQGGCREGSLDATLDMTGLDGCSDPWGGSGTAVLQGYDLGQPFGGANQARIKVVAAVPSIDARMLLAGTPYTAMALRLDNFRSSGGGSCPGCEGSACLVLNSLLVKRLPGGSGDVFLQIPGPADGNFATWNGVGANCAAVPVRTATWGRVKSLYR